MQILEETLRASERQREHDVRQQEAILVADAAEHAAQERMERLEELDKASLCGASLPAQGSWFFDKS